jgi:hypothetical protein
MVTSHNNPSPEFFFCQDKHEQLLIHEHNYVNTLQQVRSFSLIKWKNIVAMT